MSSRSVVIAVVLTTGFILAPALGDEVLYSYEANVVPYDASAGWLVFDECDGYCSESLADGHFRLLWTQAGDDANYDYEIAGPGQDPPPTLWVEWRFRSNHPLGPNFYSCDGAFVVHYGGITQLVNMYGDAAISHSGNDFVTGNWTSTFCQYIISFVVFNGFPEDQRSLGI